MSAVLEEGLLAKRIDFFCGYFITPSFNQWFRYTKNLNATISVSNVNKCIGSIHLNHESTKLEIKKLFAGYDWKV